jgi:UMP-CMP kinase
MAVSLFAEGRSPRVIFVTGAPGSGKGTQCAILAQEFGYSHYSIGDLMRAVVQSGSEEGRAVQAYKCNLVPKELVASILLKTLSVLVTHTVLIDGFPRSTKQCC